MGSLTDKINLALISATAATVIWMFTTFASASEVEEIHLDIAYGQYYDRLDDFDEAVAEGNESLAREYARQMERLKAKICENDPEWERCDRDDHDGTG
jgi:hypothetical protein